MMDTRKLLFSLRSMSVYHKVLENKAVHSLTSLLDETNQDPLAAAEQFGALCRELHESGLSLCDYIYTLALYDENPFTRMAASGEEVPAQLVSAVRHDLRALMGLSYLRPQELKNLLKARFPELEEEIGALAPYRTGHDHYIVDERDWANEIEDLAEYCRENGCGAAGQGRILSPCAADAQRDHQLLLSVRLLESMLKYVK